MHKNESELLNDVYRDISEKLGQDAALEIYRMFKGQQITFPVHLFNAQRLQKEIIKEFDGSNLKVLAKKYGYSEKTIRRIIKHSMGED